MRVRTLAFGWEIKSKIVFAFARGMCIVAQSINFCRRSFGLAGFCGEPLWIGTVALYVFPDLVWTVIFTGCSKGALRTAGISSVKWGGTCTSMRSIKALISGRATALSVNDLRVGRVSKNVVAIQYCKEAFACRPLIGLWWISVRGYRKLTSACICSISLR